jgi:threonine dehydratase
VAFKALVPSTEIVAVEPALAADAQESLRSGTRVTWAVDRVIQTIADGLRVPALGELPWAHVRELVDDIVTVEEDEIRDAMRALALGSRLVVEPSGAVPVAAFRSGRLEPVGRTAAVLSGGNVDPTLLAEVLTA